MIYIKGKPCKLHPAAPFTLEHGCVTCLREAPTYRKVVTFNELRYYKKAKDIGTLEYTAKWIKQQYENPDEFVPFVIKGGKDK